MSAEFADHMYYASFAPSYGYEYADRMASIDEYTDFQFVDII